MIYVGIEMDYHNTHSEPFVVDGEPTQETHGDRYVYVVGPFDTFRGAKYFQQYGKGNPHTQTADDAENLARYYREYWNSKEQCFEIQ